MQRWVLVVGCLCSSVSYADWPQFRGPSGQGAVAKADVPLTWSESKNVSWSTGIPGKGWSSPVVLGEHVWLTTAVVKEPTPEQIKRQLELSGLDETKFKRRQVAGNVSLRAICLNRADGTVRRDVEILNVDSPAAIHIGNSYASPTPVIEPGRLYCHFDAITACLDTASGKILWERNIPVFYSVGAGSSPVVYDDLLVLVCDGVDQQFITALDKNTGRTVWKTTRPAFRTDDGQHRKAYSTPLLVRHGGRDQLVIPGAQWFISYDPKTGEELWRVDHGAGFSNVPRPVYADGVVYVCSGFGSKELWAIRVDGSGDVTDSHVVWRQKSQIPTNPSPVLAGDRVFVVSDSGIVSCFDIATGKNVWKKRIGGNHSASPVRIGNRLYFFSQDGKVTVLKASDDFVELAVNEIEGRLMASPAIVPDAMLLRSDTRLYCIR